MSSKKVVVKLGREVAKTAEFWLDEDAGECLRDAKKEAERKDPETAAELQRRGEELAEAAEVLKAALDGPSSCSSPHR